VCYGYRFGEFMSPIKSIKEDLFVTIHASSDPNRRPPMCVSLGNHTIGFKMPYPDLSDTATNIAGVFKRTGFKHPDADPGLRAELNEFAIRWVAKHLTPLSSDHDITFESWIQQTNYTGGRKEMLRKVHKGLGHQLTKKQGACKRHPKPECYPEMKHSRGINSRSDEFKVLVGPIFSAIEKVLFKMKWFIKKVPVRDRARVVWERLYDHRARYYATDYSAFESHFDPELMEILEFVLYGHMTQNLEHVRLLGDYSFMGLVRKYIGVPQTCHYKGFTAKNVKSRMSGEMCTSLGNSFSNLMIFLFVCYKAGIREEDIDGFVEGDDGLFRFLPHQKIDDALFKALGLTIKIEKHDELHMASFCGLIFDPESLTVITDPREVLADLGWAGFDYVKCGRVRLLELLRAKSLSFAYQYPGCPIIQSLAQYGMRVTSHIDLQRYIDRSRAINMWERDQLIEAWESRHVLKEVPAVLHSTRLLVESKFGIPVHEQKRIEAKIDAILTLSPIDIGTPHWMPEAWSRHYFEYVRHDQGDYPVAFSPRVLHDNISPDDVGRLEGCVAFPSFLTERGYAEHRRIVLAITRGEST